MQPVPLDIFLVVHAPCSVGLSTSQLVVFLFHTNSVSTIRQQLVSITFLLKQISTCKFTSHSHPNRAMMIDEAEIAACMSQNDRPGLSEPLNDLSISGIAIYCGAVAGPERGYL